MWPYIDQNNYPFTVWLNHAYCRLGNGLWNCCTYCLVLYCTYCLVLFSKLQYPVKMLLRLECFTKRMLVWMWKWQSWLSRRASGVMYARWIMRFANTLLWVILGGVQLLMLSHWFRRSGIPESSLLDETSIWLVTKWEFGIWCWFHHHEKWQ